MAWPSFGTAGDGVLDGVGLSIVGVMKAARGRSSLGPILDRCFSWIVGWETARAARESRGRMFEKCMLGGGLGYFEHSRAFQPFFCFLFVEGIKSGYIDFSVPASSMSFRLLLCYSADLDHSLELNPCSETHLICYESGFGDIARQVYAVQCAGVK